MPQVFEVAAERREAVWAVGWPHAQQACYVHTRIFIVYRTPLNTRQPCHGPSRVIVGAEHVGGI